MKKIFVLLVLISAISCDQKATTFILVRHAEKTLDGTADPDLTEAGTARANRLVALFRNTDVTAFYSSNFKRTKMTVAPLAEQKKLDINIYDPKNMKEFSQKLLSDNAGGTIIISGHSDTTPMLANLLLGEEKFSQFDENDYGNILIITRQGSGKAKLLHLMY